MNENYYSGKRVIVTGAGGFIGSHLVEELVRQGARVKAFVHYNSRSDWGNIELLPSGIKKEIEIVVGDIQDPFSTNKAVNGCEIVFHLAALIGIPYSYIAPESYINTNIKGTLNVMQACLNNNISKVVHTSTSEVYGTAQYVPIDERHPLQGKSPYSASKIGADQVVESYYRSFSVPVAIIRPFNTYGPRQSARAVIPTIISQIISGNGTIKLGSVIPVRDLNYIIDTVQGFLAIGSSEKSIGQVFNLGVGKGINIEELATKIVELTDTIAQVVEIDNQRIRPDKSEVMQLICDNTKIKEIAGWEPRYTLEEGLKETIEFIQENPHFFKTDVYNV